MSSVHKRPEREEVLQVKRKVFLSARGDVKAGKWKAITMIEKIVSPYGTIEDFKIKSGNILKFIIHIPGNKMIKFFHQLQKAGILKSETIYHNKFLFEARNSTDILVLHYSLILKRKL